MLNFTFTSNKLILDNYILQKKIYSKEMINHHQFKAHHVSNYTILTSSLLPISLDVLEASKLNMLPVELLLLSPTRPSSVIPPMQYYSQPTTPTEVLSGRSASKPKKPGQPSS